MRHRFDVKIVKLYLPLCLLGYCAGVGVLTQDSGRLWLVSGNELFLVAGLVLGGGGAGAALSWRDQNTLTHACAVSSARAAPPCRDTGT